MLTDGPRGKGQSRRLHDCRRLCHDPSDADGKAIAINGFVEKPDPAVAPSRLATIGRYIRDPEVMRLLEGQEKGAGGEIQLTEALAKLIGNQPFHAHVFEGDRHDCGEKAGFIQANIALALERPDVGPAIREYLTEHGLTRREIAATAPYEWHKIRHFAKLAKLGFPHRSKCDSLTITSRYESS